ncbi:MAG TPA: NAD(+) diphosphatase [Pseudonocardiaceae bacterium]
MTARTGPSGFVLSQAPLLSRATVDRSEWLRTDPARQHELWPTSWVLPVEPGGRVPVRDDGWLALRPATGFAAAPPAGAVLLGLAPRGADGRPTAYWAAPVAAAEPLPGEHWRDLRGCGAELDDTDAGLLTAATGVLGWHARARFCAICGSRTVLRAAGWAARCVENGHEEYPRTDPAVICLVHDVDDRQVLLARQASWPGGRYSVLAGFVEAGESLEACVVREIGEEVGVPVRDVRYLGSQPWPFPRSLMVGFSAVGDIDSPVQPADGEIADARWVSRDELREALTRGAWSDRDGPAHGAAPLVLPGPVSIARRMLEAWAGVTT